LRAYGTLIAPVHFSSTKILCLRHIKNGRPKAAKKFVRLPYTRSSSFMFVTSVFIIVKQERIYQKKLIPKVRVCLGPIFQLMRFLLANFCAYGT
jgi:hypothetical protein